MRNIYETVIEHVLSLKKLFTDYNSASNQTIDRVGRWQPLGEGCFKLNVNGAIFFNLQKAGIGAILRDNKGEPIMATSIKGEALFNPETIEGLAILRGLQLCVPF